MEHHDLTQQEVIRRALVKVGLPSVVKDVMEQDLNPDLLETTKEHEVLDPPVFNLQDQKVGVQRIVAKVKEKDRCQIEMLEASEEILPDLAEIPAKAEKEVLDQVGKEVLIVKDPDVLSAVRGHHAQCLLPDQ